MAGSRMVVRRSLSASSVATSLAPISRLYPTTSADMMAESRRSMAKGKLRDRRTSVTPEMELHHLTQTKLRKRPIVIEACRGLVRVESGPSRSPEASENIDKGATLMAALGRKLPLENAVLHQSGISNGVIIRLLADFPLGVG